MLTNFFHIQRTGLFFLPFAVGNLAGPLLLGRLFDSIGRRKMVAGNLLSMGGSPAGACPVAGRPLDSTRPGRRATGEAGSCSGPPPGTRPAPSGRISAVILYVGSFQVDPDDRAAFVAAAQPHAELSRGDAGCLAFVIAIDTGDPTLVHYLERWRSREDLIAHGAAAAARGSGGNPVANTNLGFQLFEEGEPV